MNKAELKRIVGQGIRKGLRRVVAEEAERRRIARLQEISAERERAFSMVRSLRSRALGDEDALIYLAAYAMLTMRNALEAVQKTQARLKALEQERARPRREPNPKKITAAWHSLYDALWSGVATMNRCAIEAPELFGSFASQKLFWPVIKSPHKGFKESASQELFLFRRLKIGSAHPLRIVDAKWLLNDEAGKKAVELWGRVYNAELAKQKLPDFFQSGDGNKRAGWELWWNEAEKLLKAELDDPAQFERLKRVVTAPTKKKSPGRIKAHLLVMLKDRFKSMAGANKTR